MIQHRLYINSSIVNGMTVNGCLTSMYLQIRMSYTMRLKKKPFNLIRLTGINHCADDYPNIYVF